MREPRDGRPVLRLVRGSATPEELAAVVAVLVTRVTAQPAPVVQPPRSRWSYGVGLRRPLPSGPGAWRATTMRAD